MFSAHCIIYAVATAAFHPSGWGRCESILNTSVWCCLCPRLRDLWVPEASGGHDGEKGDQTERWGNQKISGDSPSFFFLWLVCSVFSSLFTLPSTCFVFFFLLLNTFLMREKCSYTCKHICLWTNPEWKAAISSWFCAFFFLFALFLTFSVHCF